MLAQSDPIKRRTLYNGPKTLRCKRNFHFPFSAMPEFEKAFSSLRRIGRGGFGKVYSGCNNLDRNSYAIKEIVLGRDFDKERAFREAQTHSQLCHVNIVRFHWTWVSPHGELHFCFYTSFFKNAPQCGKRMRKLDVATQLK